MRLGSGSVAITVSVAVTIVLIARIPLAAQGKSQKSETYSVSVDVTADGLLGSQLDSYITRGLREFDDIVVVPEDGSYSVSVVALEGLNGTVSLSVVVFDRSWGYWNLLRQSGEAGLWKRFSETEQVALNELFEVVDKHGVGSKVVSHMVLVRGAAIDPRDIAADIVAVVDAEAIDPYRQVRHSILEERERRERSSEQPEPSVPNQPN